MLIAAPPLHSAEVWIQLAPHLSDSQLSGLARPLLTQCPSATS